MKMAMARIWLSANIYLSPENKEIRWNIIAERRLIRQNSLKPIVRVYAVPTRR
jgi:hypothetical protein